MKHPCHMWTSLLSKYKKKCHFPNWIPSSVCWPWILECSGLKIGIKILVVKLDAFHPATCFVSQGLCVLNYKKVDDKWFNVHVW